MLVAGLQPGWLPWLGFFDQMRQVDAFILADELPFSTSGWAHRNRVSGPNGAIWLRLPIRNAVGMPIREVRIDNTENWRRTTLRTLTQAYARSDHAADEIQLLTALLDPKATRLVDVTVPVIHHLRDRLRIETPLILSSQQGLEAAHLAQSTGPTTATDRIVHYLQALGADELLEGAAGRAFLDVEQCREAGIKVHFHRYEHPVYRQLHGGFTPCLSVVDSLLTHGAAGTREIMTRYAGGIAT